jgi:hypothetical protein
MMCLQRGTIHRRQWHLMKSHGDIGEMAMATVQVGEYVQTMDRQAATVAFPEVIASAIASLWETATAE